MASRITATCSSPLVTKCERLIHILSFHTSEGGFLGVYELKEGWRAGGLALGGQAQVKSFWVVLCGLWMVVATGKVSILVAGETPLKHLSASKPRGAQSYNYSSSGRSPQARSSPGDKGLEEVGQRATLMGLNDMVRAK